MPRTPALFALFLHLAHASRVAPRGLTEASILEAKHQAAHASEGRHDAAEKHEVASHVPALLETAANAAANATTNATVGTAELQNASAQEGAASEQKQNASSETQQVSEVAAAESALQKEVSSHRSAAEMEKSEHELAQRHAAAALQLKAELEAERMRKKIREDDATLALVKALLEGSGAAGKAQCWVQNGDRMGCEAEELCQCSFFEQCYPKFVSVVPGKEANGGPSRTENIGVCGTSMPVLVFLSAVLFVFLLSCVVMARMYFQWRESQIPETETMDRPKSLLLPGTSAVTAVAFPTEKADGTGN